MASLEEAKNNPEKQFWGELDRIHAGMLGIEGGQQHMQPMAPQGDPAGKSIWFFATKDADLVLSAGNGKPAHFCLVGKDHDYHACVRGILSVNPSREKIDEYWSSVVEAWFPEGKSDPSLTMLEFKPDHADVWASTGNPILFGWEIAKANLKDAEPDLGVRTEIRFR